MLTVSESAALTFDDVPHEGFRVEDRRWTTTRDGAKVMIYRLPAALRGMICPASWDARWTDSPDLPDADAWWRDQPYTYDQEAFIAGWRGCKRGIPRPDPASCAVGYDACSAMRAAGVNCL